MIEMELAPPTLLLKCEALERRIAETHETLPKIRAQIRTLKSGYNGEKTLKYYIDQIPNHKYHIFYGLRLPIGTTFFQIDALLLSQNIIHIIDAKNHSGTLLFENNQLIHEFAENREVYENPIAQVNRHKISLRNLFDQNKISFIPIENLVTVCKPSTEIRITPGYKEAEQKVVRAYDLLNKIDQLDERYKDKRVNSKSISQVIKLLLSLHTPQNIDILTYFQIEEVELIPGVQCPRCLFLPMVYGRARWMCPKCHLISKDAFLIGIYDYFQLKSQYFSNPEIQEFLQMPSTRTTTFNLTKLNLPYTGIKRGRIYHQPQSLPKYPNHVFPHKTNTIIKQK